MTAGLELRWPNQHSRRSVPVGTCIHIYSIFPKDSGTESNTHAGKACLVKSQQVNTELMYTTQQFLGSIFNVTLPRSVDMPTTKFFAIKYTIIIIQTKYGNPILTRAYDQGLV